MGDQQQANKYNDFTPEELRAQFEDPTIRMGFIRKVFGIVTGQLMFTFFAMFLTATNEELRAILKRNSYLLIIAVIITFVIMIVIACCKGPGRKVPLNYILLVVFTIAETIVMCFVTLMYNTRILMIGVGLTAVICILCTLVACFSKWDFTSAACACILLIMGLVMLIFGIVMIFVPRTPILVMIFASLGAIVFSFYLIFDIQMMLGGNHANAISPEDYIFAAISIYMDIILILQYILMLLDVCDI